MLRTLAGEVFLLFMYQIFQLFWWRWKALFKTRVTTEWFQLMRRMSG